MEQSYLEIGKIVNTHGLRGDIKVVPWADYPEIFEEINFIYTKDETRYLIKNVKYQKDNVILNLENVITVEDALKLKGKIIYAKKSTMPSLEKNSYFIADLIGLDVIDENDAPLGVIDDIISAGAADVYVIKSSGQKDLLVPAIKDVIKEVNLPKGYIKITIPDGLI